MLTHLNENNLPRMVNVSDKAVTKRTATASGVIKMSRDAFLAIKQNTAKKGPVLQTAVVAAVMAAKKTGDLIPMCHPLPLSSVEINVEEIGDLGDLGELDLENPGDLSNFSNLKGEFGFKIIATAETSSQTGVEMEALTAVSVGLLTIYDMIKAIDKSMEIGEIYLLKKTGGKSGEYQREKNA